MIINHITYYFSQSKHLKGVLIKYIYYHLCTIYPLILIHDTSKAKGAQEFIFKRSQAYVIMLMSSAHALFFLGAADMLYAY